MPSCRVLTFAYVGLLFGLMAYDISYEGVDGFRSRTNLLFAAVQFMTLLPYISTSLYTNDKRIYLADASAKRYHPAAYYCSKVRSEDITSWQARSAGTLLRLHVCQQMRTKMPTLFCEATCMHACAPSF